MALSPHMSFAGVMNIGGPRHDTSQWPAEAGMTQHARRRPGEHDGAAHRRRHVRAVPGAEVLLRRDQRRDLPGRAVLHGPRLPRVQQLVPARAAEDAVAVHEGPRAVRHGARAAGGADRAGAARTTCRSSCSGGGATSRTRSARSRTRGSTSRRRSPTSTPELRHTLLVGNAAEHLHLDLDADITETPAAA